MTASSISLNWDHVYLLEREAIREPRGRYSGSDRPLTGLAFSGGGTRSATFNLGIIQALADLKLLREFDYLSCVSGGGYIGGWLSAFIHRQCNGQVELAEDKLSVGGPENPAISFLRVYSNYLTPKASLFSTDTLTGVATYLRNLHINFPLLLLTLVSLLLLPRLLVWLARELAGWNNVSPLDDRAWPLFAAGISCIVIAIVFTGLNFGRQDPKFMRFYTRQAGVIALVVIPVLFSAWLIAFGFYVGAPALEKVPLLGWVMWGALIYVMPWLSAEMLGFILAPTYGQLKFRLGALAMMAVFTMLAGAWMGVLMAAFSEVTLLIPRGGSNTHGSWITSALATVLLLYFYSLTVLAHIGLMGSYFSHRCLEWWSRLGGWILVVAAIWTASFCLTYFAPPFFIWVDRNFPIFVLFAAFLWIGLFATAYISPSKFHPHSLTGYISALLGILHKPSNKAMEVWYSLVASYIPYVVVISLLGLVAWFLHQLLIHPELCRECAQQAYMSHSYWNMVHGEASNFQHVDILWVCVFCIGGLAAATVMAWRIEVNLFSLHHFYRQRLTRCYLGASRSTVRIPNPFTGFDQCDELKLASLYHEENDKKVCQRPYVIYNTTMNLVVGKQLAWQQRHTASFSFTPMASGYSSTFPDDKGQLYSHYRPTSQYMEGVWVGAAMAISGAAALPSMGYHSSPAVAFLMTVFNVRLGHWSPNPASPSVWVKHEPPFGGTYLLKELFGNTDITSPFVYLSDGGHFENLGIYELVRRRCACIVAIDVGDDSNDHFEDIRNAVNKCYTDFGVIIDIHVRDHESSDSAVGRVLYPDGSKGALIYINPRLSNTESAVLQESTTHNGFDESQFESYRKLGHEIGRKVFEVPVMNAMERMKTESMETKNILITVSKVMRESAGLPI